MSKYIETAEMLTLPVIPLCGAVAFPSVQLNLEIARPISIVAFGASADRGKILLVAQKDPTLPVPTVKDLYKTGTVCTVKHISKTPNGNLSVTFEGICRAKVSDYVFDPTGYIRANAICKQIISDNASSSKLEKTMESIHKLLSDTKKIHPLVNDEFLHAASALKDPGMYADFVAAGALLNVKNKQLVLECFHAMSRLDRLLSLLEEEHEIIEVEFAIHQQVRKKIDDHQKEFYLREQIKTIQQELGEDNDEIEEYADAIDRSLAPKEIKEKWMKELGKLSKTPFGAAESTVLRNYLDTCLELPFGKMTTDATDIAAAKEILEKDHEGLTKVKARMLEYAAVKKFAPDLKNQILCLVGPPGIGKTSIAASLARAMKRKYARISLGGIRDEADIRGHRKTYVGAMPGRIVEALTTAGSMNPLIVLDEIDKLCRDNHGDPSSALLEVLDPEQNKYFRDHFLEFPLDLSDCIFLATANNYEDIPDALIDRMEVIELPTYSRTEKFGIATKHLLPKQRKRHGLKQSNFKVSDDALYELIDHYTREAGVRNLEREIASLARKAVVKLVEGECKTVHITAANLSEYLGKRKVHARTLSEVDEVGVVNGLAYTMAGGDLLKVEVSVMNGSGKIELTGSLGDVMKESAKIAVSYIRSIASTLGIPENFYEKKDIHIHFPEGATPKDGPSAGVTMMCALASALSGIPVRRDIAMTGELSLRGNVLPIGGLKEKTLAAYSAGVTDVCIPRENEKDLDEIDAEARSHLRFILCDTAADILKHALVPSHAETEPAPIPSVAIPSLVNTHNISTQMKADI